MFLTFESVWLQLMTDEFNGSIKSLSARSGGTLQRQGCSARCYRSIAPGPQVLTIIFGSDCAQVSHDHFRDTS